MPESFCRTLGMHYFCSSSAKFRFQCRSPSEFQSHAHSAVGTLLTAWPACPELHTRAWRVPGVGGALARLRRRALRRQNHRSGRPGAKLRCNAIRHRPSVLVAPRGHLLASARMRHRCRGLARAERVLCRRRAVRPFSRGQAVTTPSLLSWTLGWHQCFT